MSKLFSLNLHDLVKGAVVAFFSGATTFVVSVLQRMLDTHVFTVTELDLKAMLTFGAMAAIGYLGKQLITDENGKLGGRI